MDRDDVAIRALCDVVRQTAFELHTYLRHGHLEKVCENGLAHRLRAAGMYVEQQQPLKAYDEDGTVLGDYVVDLFINKTLIVELKACTSLADEPIAQVLAISGQRISATAY